MERPPVALVSVVLSLALASGVWFGGRPPPPVPVAGLVDQDPSTESTITVHVAGAVLQPGLVVLSAETRVGDAVAAAGGVTGTADLSAVNLAARLTDGAQVVVPHRDHTGGPIAAPGGSEQVRLNSADASELETLPGVGPVLAERIISHRQSQGPFQTVEDLLDVPGIGESKLAELRPHVVP